MNQAMQTNSSEMNEIQRFIAEMPKAEIHIHLEGAIHPEAVLTLAKRHNMVDRLPAADVAGLQDWFKFTDFPHFVQIYLTISDLLQTPEDFATIVYACGKDMADQNIRYRELTFTPYTHTDILDKGLTIDDLLAGLSVGRERAKDEFGVTMNWIFDIPRNTAFADRGKYNPRVAEKTLEYAIAGRDQGVVGFGLGGNEVGAPPHPFAHAFSDARKAGFRSVPHAGETMGPESVWGAIDNLEAERIGHGVRSIEDPKLLHALLERQTVLEINPTSNICLHVYRSSAEHPFPHLDRMGLNVTVNSDDPPLFNTTLCQEYELLATAFGYDKQDLARIARNAFVAATLPSETQRTLLDDFDSWIDENLDQSRQ